MLSNGMFITGTDTEVGKTFVAAGLANVLQRRLNRQVHLWKPVQSGAKLGDSHADSYRLKLGSGTEQKEADIVTYTLPAPLAPWIAATKAGVEVDYAKLIEEGKRRRDLHEFVIVEGAGGLLVPITAQHTVASLTQDLELPLIIVARAGLGTVNHTLLTISHARRMGIPIKGVIFNRCTNKARDTVKDNILMVEQFGEVPVLGVLPEFIYEIKEVSDWDGWRKEWSTMLEEHLDMEVILRGGNEL